MIRTLTMIAIAGFLVSAVTLSVAVGLTGPENILNGAWSFGPNGWGGHWQGHNHWSWSRNDDNGDRNDDGGPQTSRDLAWNGGDALNVDLDADVQYAQAPGPAKITVSGPQSAVQDVEMRNGEIRYKDGDDHDARLSIVVTAPSVTRFVMQSSGKLAIVNYHQDKLSLDLEGDADVKAAGTAKAVDLTLSGSGNADLGAVKAKSAKVDIEGSGDATLAPTDAADITVEGSGDVTLLTRPVRLQSNVSGSGRVRQQGQDGGGTQEDASR
jgi:hypothetical protein